MEPERFAVLPRTIEGEQRRHEVGLEPVPFPRGDHGRNNGGRMDIIRIASTTTIP